MGSEEPIRKKKSNKTVKNGIQSMITEKKGCKIRKLCSRTVLNHLK